MYAKQCDLSLTIKSIAVHIPGLTHLHIDQPATYTQREAAAVAELQQLTHLDLISTRGFESGALAPLTRLKNLTHLHLQLTSGDVSASSSPAISPGATATYTSSSSSRSSSSLGKLSPADESALTHLSQLVGLSVVGMPPPGASSSSALQGAAAAGKPGGWALELLMHGAAKAAEPKLQQLTITDCGLITPNMMALIANIPTIKDLTLGEVSEPGSLNQLSALQQLEALAVAPLQPPAAALDAIAAGCGRLKRLVLGCLPSQGLSTAFAKVEELQLISGTGGQPVGLTGMRRSTATLTGLVRGFPGLRILGIAGWQVDSAGVDAITQVKQLTHLLLHGRSSSQPANLLLPLLTMPGLQQIQLLGLQGLSDDWVADAVKKVGGQGGSFQAVTHLSLGAAAASGDTQVLLPSSKASGVGAAGGLLVERSNSGSAAVNSALAAAAAAAASGCNCLTDKGLVRLFVCPKLQRLELANLMGVTLAGVKALARGCPTLQQITVKGSPAVCAATPEAATRAGQCGDGRAVDVIVQG